MNLDCVVGPEMALSYYRMFQHLLPLFALSRPGVLTGKPTDASRVDFVRKRLKKTKWRRRKGPTDKLS